MCEPDFNLDFNIEREVVGYLIETLRMQINKNNRCIAEARNIIHGAEIGRYDSIRAGRWLLEYKDVK
jgi:hypothetical protein